jgi:hypothetical protein
MVDRRGDPVAGALLQSTESDRLVRIDRQSAFGFPFITRADGHRQGVIANFRESIDRTIATCWRFRDAKIAAAAE